MKVRETAGHGTCEACGKADVPIWPVIFERANTVKLICGTCKEWTREVLELVDVKEAEA